MPEAEWPDYAENGPGFLAHLSGLITVEDDNSLEGRALPEPGGVKRILKCAAQRCCYLPVLAVSCRYRQFPVDNPGYSPKVVVK